MSYRLVLIGAVLLLLQSCSSRTGPAPVVLLNSQADQESGGFTSDTYKVQPGDTLFGIAWYTGNDYRDIAKFNSLSEPYRIFPGQELRITPPPKIVKISTRSKPQTTQSADPTTTTVDKSLIDPPKPRAYGEGEKVVKRQNVTSVNRPSESVKITAANSFPNKVKKWVWPTKGRVVETFSKSESGNKGIDIAAAKGTSIHAAADGKVVYSGSALRGYGNFVIIKHTDTFLSAYAYNDNIIVKERDWVSAGQKIATMGDSGTNSVKLHFEVRYRGKSLDPLRYLPATRP